MTYWASRPAKFEVLSHNMKKMFWIGYNLSIKKEEKTKKIRFDETSVDDD